MKVSQKITKRLALTTSTGFMLGLSACELYVVDHEGQLPLQPVEPIVQAEPTPPPEPLQGSDQVVFMDSTSAQLAGCRTISTIRFSHNGSFADGMIILRNAAIQINANRMVPIRLMENIENNGGPHLYQVKLMRCPEPETQGTKSNG